jgi:hypothetical protein
MLFRRHHQIIIDFTLVLGIDSSAAQAIIKLRNYLSNHGIMLTIFVPGSLEGFPCEINLTEELNYQPVNNMEANGFNANDQRLLARLTGSRVCDDLDTALVCAEVRNTSCWSFILNHSILTC